MAMTRSAWAILIVAAVIALVLGIAWAMNNGDDGTPSQGSYSSGGGATGGVSVPSPSAYSPAPSPAPSPMPAPPGY